MFLEIVKSVPNVSNDFIFPKYWQSPFHLSTLMIIRKMKFNQSNKEIDSTFEEYERRETSEFGPEFARLCSDMISPDYKEN